MKNVFDIDDKLLAKNPVNIAWVNLSEEISKFLPVNSISINVIEYSCKVHLYEKKIEWDWMDKVDCYLGIPEYIETENDLYKVKYKIFPLSLVYQIAQLSTNNLHFSLRFEPNIENEVYILHFDYETFTEHLSSFERGLENNLEYWVPKSTLKWKARVKKIKDNPYKYSDFRENTQLSHYYYTRHKKNIRENIIRAIIKENFDYSIGQDYGTWEHLKKRGDFEDITEAFNYSDIPTLYDIENDAEDDKKENNIISFNNLFPTLNSFGVEVIHYHLILEIEFEHDTTNYIFEQELDFLNKIISNTNNRLLKKFGYLSREEQVLKE